MTSWSRLNGPGALLLGALLCAACAPQGLTAASAADAGGPPRAAQLVVNEVGCKGPSWLELGNAGDAPLGLHALVVDDGAPGHAQPVADAVLAPGAHVVVALEA